MKNFRLIDQLQTAIVVIDKNMNVIDANDAYAKRSRRELTGLFGKKCYEAAYNFSEPCSEKPEQTCPLNEVFNTKQATSRIHHFWIEDHAVVEEVTTTPITEDNGDVKYVIEEFRDITKLLGLKEGILSTCSYCKKIRDENGQWVGFDVYLHNHTGADFSHGVCEDCHNDLLQDLKLKTPDSP